MSFFKAFEIQPEPVPIPLKDFQSVPAVALTRYPPTSIATPASVGTGSAASSRTQPFGTRPFSESEPILESYAQAAWRCFRCHLKYVFLLIPSDEQKSLMLYRFAPLLALSAPIAPVLDFHNFKRVQITCIFFTSIICKKDYLRTIQPNSRSHG